MKYTALLPLLEFHLEQSRYLIWFLSGFMFSSCCQLIMGFYWLKFCTILAESSQLGLLSGPSTSSQLFLLVNQSWAVLSSGAVIFPDFWDYCLAAKRKKGWQYQLPALVISPIIVPYFLFLENCPCNLPLITSDLGQRQKVKNIFGVTGFCGFWR